MGLDLELTGHRDPGVVGSGSGECIPTEKAVLTIDASVTRSTNTQSIRTKLALVKQVLATEVEAFFD